MKYSGEELEISHQKLLIGGDWVAASAQMEVHNPARPRELVGTAAGATAEQADDALMAARRAQREWGRGTFRDRARLLSAALERLDQDLETRAVLFVRENGKTLAEATRELSSVQRRQRLSLQHAAALDAGRQETSDRSVSRIRYKPYGVVVSIVPWNAPVSLGFTQIVSALLAGNAVVLKPPETCPLTLTQTAGLFAQALPKGLLNIVTGLPEVIGETLTAHPAVGKIGFTGSIKSARRILVNASATIKPCALELGGNDPAILLDDVEFGDEMLGALLAASFQMAGQICMAIKRLFVPERRRDALVAGLRKRGARILVGNGLKRSVTMGPVHTRAALERLVSFLDDARERGAEVHPLGTLDPETEGS